jgi:hypothetical protein
MRAASAPVSRSGLAHGLSLIEQIVRRAELEAVRLL